MSTKEREALYKTHPNYDAKTKLFSTKCRQCGVVDHYDFPCQPVHDCHRCYDKRLHELCVAYSKPSKEK